MLAAPSARPRVRSLLLAQFADGFGGRFHGLLLGLYALTLGGLDGFAGFVAVSLAGTGVAAVTAGALATRIGGDRIMRAAGVALLTARLVSYVLLPVGLPLAGLLALRLLGSVSGSLVNTATKAQVPDGQRATASLAWMNVANGGGQAAAALAAGLLSTASPLAIALLGGPVAVAATLPAYRLARFATAAPIAAREQLAGLRAGAVPAVVGAAVFVLLNALPAMGDGITAERYAAAWLGPLSIVSFCGSVLAAVVIRKLTWRPAGTAGDARAWSALAAVAVVAWATVDRGVVWLFLAQFVSGAVAPCLAALVESRILERVGRARAVPALAASGAVAAFGGAGTSLVVPLLVRQGGFAGAAVALCAGLAGVAVVAAIGRRVRAARRVSPAVQLAG